MKDTAEERIRALTKVAKNEAKSLSAFAWTCLAGVMRSPTREDVEDVMSDAYLTAATRLRNDPNLVVENLRAWFRKVLFFRCLQYGKKWRPEHWAKSVEELESQDEMMEILDQAARPTHKPELSVLVSELLETLDSAEREILELALQGYTSTEIADKLGGTPESIRKAKSRSIAKLRQLMFGE